MGRRVTTAPERHLIKKYANRKLYDTRTSRYITLDGIAQLVRDGHEIKVVDRDNGNDLTPVTLSQIVLSEEKRGPARLVDAGGEMLHDRGQALLDYVRKTLNVPADLRSEVGRRREGLERMADDAIERAPTRSRAGHRRWVASSSCTFAPGLDSGRPGSTASGPAPGPGRPGRIPWPARRGRRARCRRGAVAPTSAILAPGSYYRKSPHGGRNSRFRLPDRTAPV